MSPGLKKKIGPLTIVLLAVSFVLVVPCQPLAKSAAAKGGPQKARIVLAFSGPASEWRDLAFPGIKRQTLYTVIDDHGQAYVRARSKASASALYMPLDLDAGQYPVLSWRWKIEGVLARGDARTKAGDDYAARLYVTFARDPVRETLADEARAVVMEKVFGRKVPGSALNYVWATRLQRGAMVPNPYTPRSMMIAVESGNARSGRWVREERNIVLDYEKAFGRRPPRITGIAIMTDSDDTGGQATAWYGTIVFRRKTGQWER